MLLFNEKGGSVRPIVTGFTLYCLVSKIVCCKIANLLCDKFCSIQLCLKNKCGCQAAVYAARTCIATFSKIEGFLKIDVCNANLLERHSLSIQIIETISKIFLIIH